MNKSNSNIVISDEVVLRKIYLIRGLKVMLDRDLAELYGLETKRLKESVRRNIERFPEDFMFELTKEEFTIWRSQFATSNAEKIGLRIPPFAFTEHGVLMLASVLNSKLAIQVNIHIVRIFTKIREAYSDSLNLKLELSEIKKKLENHDKDIVLIFNFLDKLIQQDENPQPRPRIGYKRAYEKD